jgi:hypothetical protein
METFVTKADKMKILYAMFISGMKFPALGADRLKEIISDSSREKDLGRNVFQNFI